MTRSGEEMADAQQPYTDGQPDPEGGQYDGAHEPPQSPTQGSAAPAAGAKKKRAYAGQAYEFGAGANAALGGQPPAGAGYPGSPPPAVGGYGFPGQPAQQQQPQQPSYGIPQQPQYNDPNAQTPAAQPGYVPPQYGAPQAGYEPPQQAGYQPPGPGVQGVQQQFQQMSIGGQPQSQAQQMRLNPLQPVDIGPQGQPFHVTDLDQPPPPIILPPNVSKILHATESS